MSRFEQGSLLPRVFARLSRGQDRGFSVMAARFGPLASVDQALSDSDESSSSSADSFASACSAGNAELSEALTALGVDGSGVDGGTTSDGTTEATDGQGPRDVATIDASVVADSPQPLTAERLEFLPGAIESRAAATTLEFMKSQSMREGVLIACGTVSQYTWGEAGRSACTCIALVAAFGLLRRQSWYGSSANLCMGLAADKPYASAIATLSTRWCAKAWPSPWSESAPQPSSAPSRSCCDRCRLSTSCSRA